MGFYAIEENFDDLFIAARYNNATGNAYRDEFANTMLTYLGTDNPQAYANETRYAYGNQSFENVYLVFSGPGTFSDLVQLIRATNATVVPDDQCQVAVSKILYVERFLRYHALETFLCNDDAFSSNGNNWLIYNNPDTGLFEWWGHDFDDSVSGLICNISNFYHNKDGKVEGILARRVMNVPAFAARFYQIMGDLADGFDSLLPVIQQQFGYVKAMLTPTLSNDPWYDTEYDGPGGRTINQFLGDLAFKTEYFTLRDANVRGQLNGTIPGGPSTIWR